jgi:hypothetical protein
MRPAGSFGDLLDIGVRQVFMPIFVLGIHRPEKLK